VLHLLYFTFQTFKKLFRTRLDFFKQAWNVFDCVIMIMDWTAAGLYGLRLVLTNITINAFHQNKREIKENHFLK